MYVIFAFYLFVYKYFHFILIKYSIKSTISVFIYHLKKNVLNIKLINYKEKILVFTLLIMY
jgi:hypothetical protein